MQHALRNNIRMFNVNDVTMFIGPARSGALLEVGVVGLDDDDDPVAIHAMPLREKFHPFL